MLWVNWVVLFFYKKKYSKLIACGIVFIIGVSQISSNDYSVEDMSFVMSFNKSFYNYSEINRQAMKQPNEFVPGFPINVIVGAISTIRTINFSFSRNSLFEELIL